MGILSVAVWHWLLCSWHLSPFRVSLATLLPVLLSFCTLSSSTWKLHGPLCVRACVPVYTCIERYICGGRGEGMVCSSGLAARTLRTGACHLPSVLGDKGVWVGALLSSLQGHTWMLGSRLGSAAIFLKLLLSERMKWHWSLDDCSKELLFCSASLGGRRVEPTHFYQSRALY